MRPSTSSKPEGDVGIVPTRLAVDFRGAFLGVLLMPAPGYQASERKCGNESGRSELGTGPSARAIVRLREMELPGRRDWACRQAIPLLRIRMSGPPCRPSSS